MKTKFYLGIAALLFTATVSSCKKDDNGDVNATAYIMATNSAEGSAAQDFYVDNDKINANAMAYTQSTAYTSVKAGDHQIQFKTNNSATVNSTASLSPNAGEYYSVFYLDDKTTVTAKDDQTAPQSGKARVRFINLSLALTSNVDFGIATGNKIASGLARKVASAYYEVDAASAFSLYSAGSTSVLLNIPVTLQAGRIYTIYISGSTQATITYHLLVQK